MDNWTLIFLRNSLLSTWNELKNYYHLSNVENIQHRISLNLKEEENLMIILIILISSLLEWTIFPVIILSFEGFTLQIFKAGIILYLLKTRKKMLLRVIFFIYLLIIPMFIAKSENFRFILALQIFLAMLPSIYFMITKSLFYSILTFIISVMQCLWILRPKTMEIFHINENDIREDILDTMTFCSFVISAIINVVFYIFSRFEIDLVGELRKQKQCIVKLNQEIVQKNEEIQETIGKKTNLLLSISHEVRNPLNIISGSNEIASFENSNPMVQTQLDTIQDTIELLTYILNNMLDTTKMEIKELDVSRRKIETCQLIESIWKTTKIMANKKGLSGKIYVSKDIPGIIKIDRMRIMQIIFNLVGNAIKFTPVGYVGVIISWINDPNYQDSMLFPTDETLFRDSLKVRKHIKEINEVRRSISIPSSKAESNQNTLSLYKSENIEEEKQGLPIPSLRHFTVKRVKSIKDLQLLSKYKMLDVDDLILPELSRDSSYAKGYLKIEMIDSGYGIKEENMHRLFKKFEQFGIERHKRLGAGLGLWLANKWCQKLDGYIKLHSIYRKGTVAVVLIKCT